MSSIVEIYSGSTWSIKELDPTTEFAPEIAQMMGLVDNDTATVTVTIRYSY